MNDIKLGLTAFDTCTGLGNQTRAYFDHLKPYKTLVSDISAWNHQKRYPEWYKQNDPEQFEVIFDYGFPSHEVIDKFLDGLDAILVAENPLNYYMFQRARELGIKSILVPNFEFLEFLRTPVLPKPDLFLVPSIWRIKEIEQFGPTRYLHFPVDRNLLPYREIKEFDFFLHNIGNPAVHDRNGILSIMDAMKLIDDPKVKIHIHGPTIDTLKDIPIYYGRRDERMSWGLSGDVIDYWHLYKVGSVLLLPRRYGGNCLPMNEALSIGMPVIMTDVEPQNTFLPKEWLVPATPKESFRARTDITVYEADPNALAEKMKWFANLSSEEMLAESKKADALAETISWDMLLPEYTKIIEDLCNQS
jgi:glycosyltransferase involved in cell wall biosynthesis